MKLMLQASLFVPTRVFMKELLQTWSKAIIHNVIGPNPNYSRPR